MPQSYSKQDRYVCVTEHWDVGHFGVVGYDQSSFTDSFRSESRTFGGTVTPSFKTFRKANGYLPTNFASDIVVRIEGLEVEQTQYTTVPNTGERVPYYRRKIKSTLSMDSPGDGDAPSLVDVAWSKVRKKVLDQDFNAPVFLAEASKTVQMMVDRSSSLYRAYRSFRKGNLAGVARELGLSPKTIHNTWLEYKYGWTPLLNDIYGGAVSLSKVKPAAGDISTFRASARSDRKFTGSGSGVSHDLTVRDSASAWVTVRIRHPDTSAANRLGFLNPLLIAWELIPFSFVADWFVNVGDCLSELTAFNGVEILSGGSYWKVQASGSLTEVNPLPWDNARIALCTYSKFSRLPGVQTLPRLQIKSNPLNLSKLITSAALLRQVTSHK